jgi:hypothetical protein
MANYGVLLRTLADKLDQNEALLEEHASDLLESFGSDIETLEDSFNSMLAEAEDAKEEAEEADDNDDEDDDDSDEE